VRVEVHRVAQAVAATCPVRIAPVAVAPAVRAAVFLMRQRVVVRLRALARVAVALLGRMAVQPVVLLAAHREALQEVQRVAGVNPRSACQA